MYTILGSLSKVYPVVSESPKSSQRSQRIRIYSPPRSSLMQFQAVRGARNYVPQNIETRGEKQSQLRLFNGMVLARQNQVSVEFDQYIG
jgi:hypothetical protein